MVRSRVWQVVAVLSIIAFFSGLLLVSGGNLSRLAPDLPTPEEPLASATPAVSIVATASPSPALPADTPTTPPASGHITLPAGPRPDKDAPEQGSDDETPVAPREESALDPTPEPVDPAKSIPTVTPISEPSPTSIPVYTPSPTPVPTNTPADSPTAVPPAPTNPPADTPTAVPPAPTNPPADTPTAVPTSTPTASATVTRTRTPTPSPTISGPFSFQVLPSGDFQVFRGGVAQIAGSPPAGGIKLYMDGNEYRTPAGGRLSSGALLTVVAQSQLAENLHVTTFTGTLGLSVTQTISYAVGTSYFQLRWDIASPARADARFFYAFDSALDGNDLGDPYFDAATGKIGIWSPGLHNRFMGLQPVTPASAYTLGPVAGPNGWAAMNLSDLRSFFDGSGTDNYLTGLQWNNRVRSDTLWTVEVRLTFAPPG